MKLKCIKCGKPYEISDTAMEEIGYTKYSYCEDCLRKALTFQRLYEKKFVPESKILVADLQECREALLKSFPGSFINEQDEFIAHPRTNQYIILKDCKTPLDIECKVLEWFSRPSHKTAPFSQNWRNRKFHEFMRNGVNAFLDTSFTEQEMSDIYDALGNAIDHKKTIRFIENGYDFNILKEE